jgi:hypothetical protein
MLLPERGVLTELGLDLQQIRSSKRLPDKIQLAEKTLVYL